MRARLGRKSLRVVRAGRMKRERGGVKIGRVGVELECVE